MFCGATKGEGVGGHEPSCGMGDTNRSMAYGSASFTEAKCKTMSSVAPARKWHWVDMLVSSNVMAGSATHRLDRRVVSRMSPQGRECDLIQRVRPNFRTLQLALQFFGERRFVLYGGLPRGESEVRASGERRASFRGIVQSMYQAKLFLCIY